MPISPRPMAARGQPLLALGIILIGANLRAPITALGPALGHVQAALGLSDARAGLLNAIPLAIFAAFSLIAPRIGRDFGFARVLAWALLAIALGTLLRSMPGASALWAGTVLLGAGIAFGNVLLPGLVKQERPQHAASLIGFYAAAMAAMAGLASGLAAPISAAPGWGWRWALGIWALPALATLLLWLPQLLSRTAPAAAASPQPARAAAEPPKTAQHQRSPWRTALGWQVSLFFALHSLIFYALVDWYAAYASSTGLGAGQAGFFLLIYQVVAVAANLLTASWIKRSQGQSLIGLLCGLALAVGVAGLWLAPHWSLYWLICAGIGAGIAMVTSLSLFALRTRDHHQASALSGMAQCVGYAGAALGPLLVGVLRDISGSWQPALLVLLGAAFLVGLFAALAGRPRFLQ